MKAKRILAKKPTFISSSSESSCYSIKEVISHNQINSTLDLIRSMKSKVEELKQNPGVGKQHRGHQHKGTLTSNSQISNCIAIGNEKLSPIYERKNTFSPDFSPSNSESKSTMSHF